ncbi:MAG: SpoIIE family protein phosphatase [Bacteroidia bacterium]
MLFNRIIFFLFILAFIGKGKSFAQTGNYYLTNFSPSEINGSDDNRGAIQDEFGRIYVANANGVLVYDGKNWRSVSLNNESRCIFLAKDKNNKIFVGGVTEFGYLTTEVNGKIAYKSLSRQLSEKELDFGYVWSVRCIGDDVFFCANERIFLYSKGKLRSFIPEIESFHTFFSIGKDFFVREKQVGFKVLVNGNLLFLPGSEIFKDNRVDFIIPYKDNLYWLGSRTLGLHLLFYNEKEPLKTTITKVKSPCDEWMAQNELYCGAWINEKTYAIGSLKGGALIVDRDFKPLKQINYKSGLQDPGVQFIYPDYNGNLWLALASGVSFIEVNTPITRWTKNNGIKGTVEASIKFENNLYIATGKGLQVYNPLTNNFDETEINDQTWGFLKLKRDLLIANSSGLYRLRNNKISLVFEEGLYSVFAEPNDSTILYLGTSNSELIAGHYYNGTFTEIKRYSDWGTIRSMSFDKEKRTVFATEENGLFLLDYKKSFRFSQLGEKNGLPLTDNYVFNYNNQVLIGTDDSCIMEITLTDPAKCMRSKKFNPFPYKQMSIAMAKQVNQEIWFMAQREADDKSRIEWLGTLVPEGKGMKEDPKMLTRIKGISTRNFNHDSSLVYISTNDGLICYDINARPKQIPIYTFISKCYLNNDTTNFVEYLTPESKYPQIDIPFDSKNDINFIPSASDYFDKNELEFSWYLEGKDTVGFRNYEKISRITYNNLSEGIYKIHIKAKDILGEEGKEISFSFTILPPWYRTNWAYAAYLLLLIAFVWLIVKLNTRRLKDQNIRLENTITERTQTIVHQKAELEHKNQEITDSINYAKRIQLSILPDLKEINKSWADTFVFYQPKDIVSGDFYWYRKINENEFLIAVADCTGHGVPGGFMSMICSDKLHQGADRSNDPSEILFYTNNAVKHALNQGNVEGGGKDGMEIALLRVNIKTKQVSYSGANRFLWIIRKGTDDIEDIKPTKASIGSFTEHDFRYELHTFDLESGDRLYMSSDGYPDQFGGPDEKKYLTRNFKKFILKIKEHPVEKQRILLQEEINNWMNGIEQVDDLLVIGLRM